VGEEAEEGGGMRKIAILALLALSGCDTAYYMHHRSRPETEVFNATGYHPEACHQDDCGRAPQ